MNFRNKFDCDKHLNNENDIFSYLQMYEIMSRKELWRNSTDFYRFSFEIMEPSDEVKTKFATLKMPNSADTVFFSHELMYSVCNQKNPSHQILVCKRTVRRGRQPAFRYTLDYITDELLMNNFRDGITKYQSGIRLPISEWFFNKLCGIEKWQRSAIVKDLKTTTTSNIDYTFTESTTTTTTTINGEIEKNVKQWWSATTHADDIKYQPTIGDFLENIGNIFDIRNFDEYECERIARFQQLVSLT